MKKLLSGLFIFSLLVGLIAAGSAYSAEKVPKEINFGSSGGAYGKAFISGFLGTAHARGLMEQEFKKEGIKFNWYFFKNQGPACNEAFANNTLDFSQNGTFPGIIGKAAGLKTRMLLTEDPGDSYIMVPSDSKITSIQGLKGKRIGCLRGTNTEQAFLRILELYGLTEKDVRIINQAAVDTESALATKDVDAGVVGLRIRDTGVAKVLFSTNPAVKAIVPNKSYPDSGRSITGVYVTEKFAREYPDITKRVVKVLLKAAQWDVDPKNRNAVLHLWSQSGTPYSNLKEQYKLKPAKELHRPIIDEFTINHLKATQDFALRKKYIKRTFDIEKWVDTSYQEQALKELGQENFWPRRDKNGNIIRK